MKKSIVTWGLLLVALYEISKRRQVCACGDEGLIGGFSLPGGGGTSNQNNASNYTFPGAVQNAGAGGCACGGSCPSDITPPGIISVQQSQTQNPANNPYGFISASFGILARDPYTGNLYTVYSQPTAMQAILSGADIVRPDGSNYQIMNTGGNWYLDGKAII